MCARRSMPAVQFRSGFQRACLGAPWSVGAACTAGNARRRRQSSSMIVGCGCYEVCPMLVGHHVQRTLMCDVSGCTAASRTLACPTRAHTSAYAHRRRGGGARCGPCRAGRHGACRQGQGGGCGGGRCSGCSSGCGGRRRGSCRSGGRTARPGRRRRGRQHQTRGKWRRRRPPAETVWGLVWFSGRCTAVFSMMVSGHSAAHASARLPCVCVM
jgi:hypothetical protein